MMDRWNNETTPHIVLGTVQLGMPYGVANDAGMPNRQTACAIVETALRNGIRHFDTAQAYGESERILGGALAQLGASDSVHVTTKLSASLDPRDPKQVRASIDLSLDRLQLPRLWCVMLHDPAWIASWDARLGETLRDAHTSGRVEHLGVSLRTPDDARSALACRDIAVIQAPCNAWDRRMAERGYIEEARQKGKMCCIRSVYLQGLLTMPPEKVRARLPRAGDAAARWWGLAKDLGMSTKELAMRYALTLNSPLVVGAEAVAQLSDTVAMMSLDPLTPDAIERIAKTMDPVLSNDIIEPFRWEQP